MSTRQNQSSEAILVLAPSKEDRVFAIDVLERGGFTVRTCEHMAEVCDGLREGAVAALMTEDALRSPDDCRCLTQMIQSQPAWCDRRILVLTAKDLAAEPEDSGPIGVLTDRGVAQFLDRPLRKSSLLHAVMAARGFARRNDELRDFMHQRDHISRSMQESGAGYDSILAQTQRDMADRQQAEEALRVSEERLQMALDAGHMGAWEWRIPGGPIMWSRTLEEIHGIEPGSFGGTLKDFERDIHPEDRELVTDAIQTALRDQEDYHVEYRIIKPDGSIAWLEARGRLFVNDDGKPQRMSGICADITERKLVEEELARHRDHLAELVSERTRALEDSHARLRHSERMAAMGTLAAGLGHDMGNLVFPLRIRLDLMRSRKLPAKLREDLESIHKAVDYLQRLANGLRHMAMDPGEIGVGVESTDLNEWWADVEPVLSNALPRGISLERRFPAELPPIAIAPHGLTQAIFNLVQNAADAMRGRNGGSVLIRARPADDGQSLRLLIIDDGPGMSPDVRQRCLEPFFTTKVRGISTGLGLSLVHGIVRRAGGGIDLESEVGKGTTWTLMFPVSRQEQAASGSCADLSRVAVSIGDARMAAFVTAMLRSLGFDASSCQSPGAPADGHAVWVTEAHEGVENEIADFLDRRDDHRVLLLGDAPEGLDHPRLIDMEHPPTSEAIRRALRRLMQEQSA